MNDRQKDIRKKEGAWKCNSPTFKEIMTEIKDSYTPNKMMPFNIRQCMSRSNVSYSPEKKTKTKNRQNVNNMLKKWLQKFIYMQGVSEGLFYVNILLFITFGL